MNFNVNSQYEDIRFLDEPTPANMAGGVALMRRNQDGFPGGEEWVDDSVAQIELGAKHMIVGWYNSEPVAVGVYKRASENPLALDIRHVSAADEVAGRMFGSFVVTQMEVHGQLIYPGIAVAIGNTKASNKPMRRFAAGLGYHEHQVTILGSPYGHNGEPDVTFIKALGNNCH